LHLRWQCCDAVEDGQSGGHPYPAVAVAVAVA